MDGQHAISLAFLISGYEFYVLGAFCSWWVAWRCFRQGEVPSGLFCLFAYPLVTFPLWLLSGRKSVQKWGAGLAISLSTLFLTLALLNFSAALGVLSITAELWDSWVDEP